MIDSFQMKIRFICLYVLVWITILDMYLTILDNTWLVLDMYLTSVRQTLLRLISSYVLVSRNDRSDGIALYFVLYGIGSPWVDRNDFCITVGLDCSVQQVKPLFFLIWIKPSTVLIYMYWSRVLVCLAEHSSSARDHVGNFPTDIETSSLPAACHGYYQIQRLTPHRTDIASDASRMTGWQPLMGIQGQNICLWFLVISV